MTQENPLNEAVLVVDDEPMLTELLSSYISGMGYNVIEANDGAKALAALRENQCFLVFTDLNMPVMSGLEMAKNMRETHPLLPIILLTGYGERNTVVEALRTGITDFFDKPFDMKKIGAAVKKFADQRLLDIKREARELEDLRQIFVEEANSVLSELEALVSSLDPSHITSDELAVLYRKVHTLKGSAGTLPSSGNLVKLAHAFETILTGVRESKVEMSRDLHQVMLLSVDELTACIQAISQGEILPDTSHLVDELQKFSSNTAKAKGRSSGGDNVKHADFKAKGDQSDEGLLVSNHKLESLKELAGELVAFKNTFDVFLKQHAELLGGALRELMDMDRNLFKITDQIQSEITDIQQVTLGKTFVKFPRVIRQIATELGKQISLAVVGQDMTVDRLVSRALSDALIHAVRNSCDHGIEKPEARVAAGKPANGTVTIRGQQNAEIITIEVTDDGAGLRRDRILKKAIERGMVSPEQATSMPDGKVWDLLFEPNFSTADQVSNISGRGVGMDVVKTVALKFGGTAWFDTVAEKSTTLTIQFPIPRSLVVEQSVVASVGDLLLAIPLSSISEIRTVAAKEMGYLAPFWTIQHRGTTVPVGGFDAFIRDTTGKFDPARGEKVRRDGLVAILNFRGQHVGLQLDSVVDQIEAVIRPFDEMIGRMKGFRGVSRLPNDGVAYVVSAEDAVRSVFDDLTSSGLNVEEVRRGA